MKRREFIEISALSAAGLMFGCSRGESAGDDLYLLSKSLLKKWCAGMRSLQIKDPKDKNFGGIRCPACGFIHGRIGDAVFPFVYLAKISGDAGYADAACALFDWQERFVSQEDGSWINDVVGHSWKGITVFGAAALAEAIKHGADVLPSKDLQRMKARLRRAADFMRDTFKFGYGNINYPVTASFSLALCAQVLEDDSLAERAQYFAHGALKYLTPKSKLLFGESNPLDIKTPKGCYAVDLGYNVEESLPALVNYAKLTGDEEVLEAAEKSMRSHLEFMLADGAWDNSWGIRNFKWTYWGSRTSDGCSAALAALADRDPVFYKAALRNTQLLERCTADNLLYGGLDFRKHGIPACVHHTFAHAKVMADVLSMGRIPVPNLDSAKLPREKEYGVKFFDEIQTALVSVGDYRATVTGYDLDYYNLKNGHASGGAISMLWHKKAGPIIVASLNDYTLVEPENMQAERGMSFVGLTPRIEADIEGIKYRNISDFNADMKVSKSDGNVLVETASNLVDANQNSNWRGKMSAKTLYEFAPSGVTLKFACKSKSKSVRPRIIFPIISAEDERVDWLSENRLTITKKNCVLEVSCDKPMRVLPVGGGRAFNYVPGFEALPLFVESGDASVKVRVV